MAISPYSKYVSLFSTAIWHVYIFINIAVKPGRTSAFATEQIIICHGHLIWTLTWTSCFKYKLRQLLFVCVAGKPVSKHIYIYTFDDKPVFCKYVYIHSYEVIRICMNSFVCVGKTCL